MSRPVPLTCRREQSPKIQAGAHSQVEAQGLRPTQGCRQARKATRSFQLMRQSAIGRLWALQKKATRRSSWPRVPMPAARAHPRSQTASPVAGQESRRHSRAAPRQDEATCRGSSAEPSHVRARLYFLGRLDQNQGTDSSLHTVETEKHAQTRLDQRRKTLTSIKRSLEAGVTEFHGFFNPEELEELGLSIWLTSRKRFSRTKKRVKKIKGAVETNPLEPPPAEAGEVNVESAKISQEQKVQETRARGRQRVVR